MRDFAGFRSGPAAGWLNAFLSYFYPEWCQVCGKARAVPAHGYVCDACRSTVRFVEAPYCERCGRPYQGAITHAFVCAHCLEVQPCYKFARSAALARDAVLDAIHLYKYRRAICVEPFLAELLVRQATPTLRSNEWDCIVPVPLHPVKQRERDFNQAQRLALHLSRATGIPLRSDVVLRIAPTRTQTQLNREERFANVSGAFRPTLKNGLERQKVVLIDDVFTTGATTNACAEALVEGGAAAVCVWTVARGI